MNNTSNIEESFSLTRVLEDIKLEVQSTTHTLDTIISSIHQWIDDYKTGVFGKTYRSKDIRLSCLDEDKITQAAISLLFSTYILGNSTIQAYSSHLESGCKFHEDKWNSIKTSAEIIAACTGIIYDIYKPKIGSGDTFSIKTKISLPTHLQARLSRCFFLPPSLYLPENWSNLFNGGYVLSKECLILGDKFNKHDMSINYSVINILQGIGYKLIDCIIDTEEKPKDEWDKEQLEQFNLAQKQSRYIYKLYKDKSFYFTYQYDKRGRVYAKGYDINPQGNSYRKAMLEFTRKEKLSKRGVYWLKVDMANHMGLDKLNWDERISYIDTHIDDMLDNSSLYEAKADEPLLFKRALLAYKQGVIEGKAIGHICHLDATASGPQIMSVIMRDKEAMKYFNVLGSEVRYDYYTLVAKEVYNRTKDSALWSSNPDFKEIRKLCKKAIMTSYYNSKVKPKEIFGDDTPELKAYYDVLNELTPGAIKLMDIINSCWRDTKTVNHWLLPDKHTSYCPVTKSELKRIELKEISSVTKYMLTLNKPNPNEYRSLCPNVIHSIDGFICRMIVMQLHSKGIQISPIHDSFGVHPNYCDELRRSYRGVMARLYREDIIEDILSTIVGSKVVLDKPKLDWQIEKAIRSNEEGYYIC